MLAFFWGSLLLIGYAYVGYPLMLWICAAWRGSCLVPPSPSESPLRVSILFAARNEERVIGEKLASLVMSQFPTSRYEILVGDDASEDDTPAIVQACATRHPQVRLLSFVKRRGKPAVLNQLAHEARGDVLVFTDADIMFAPQAIARIAAWFERPEIGVVAGNILAQQRHDSSGIGWVEDAYTRREIRIKRWQSELSGVVIAPFGACYAIRRADFQPVPDGHCVDDFIISLRPQIRGRRAVQALDVICFEEIRSDATGEFRRKVRLSRGNFQNLALFRAVALRIWKPLGFHFFSHKVLRWVCPELLALSAVACAWLALERPVYRGLFALMILACLSPWIDRGLRRCRIPVGPMRFAAHFLHMNVALAWGLVQWLGGKRGGVWEPTTREQRQSMWGNRQHS